MYRYVKGTVKLLKGEVTKLGDRFEYFVNLRPERYIANHKIVFRGMRGTINYQIDQINHFL